MKKHNHLLILFISLIGFTSCQKVIDIDLNSSAPQIVIEGTITDQPGPYTVKITKTANFSETNIFPAVSGAAVTINDDAGNSETLVETSSGIYTGNVLQGIPGRKYNLSVTAEGRNYLSTCTMPYPTKIDTLIAQKSWFEPIKFAALLFQDSAGYKNYYRLVEIKNGVTEKTIFITEDRLRDGKPIPYFMFTPNDSVRSGDSVTVQLQGIDKGVYNYFFTLLRTSRGGSASPTNPTSNISNKALGYFSAYAVRSKSIVAP